MADTAQGFLRPTTTPTPDEIFDVWLPQLSGAELKVLLYIVRRTFGFQKEVDSISFSQICEGITTRDGRVLDRGTGLARTTAYQAVQKLEALGLITVDRSQHEDGSNATNVYSLRFRAPSKGKSVGGGRPGGRSTGDPGVDRKVTQGRPMSDPSVGQKETPQQTVGQLTDEQETDRLQRPPAPPEDTVTEEASNAGDAGMSDVEEATNYLVAFGVWRNRARSVVRQLGLTPDVARQACDALQREIAGGARFDNPAAVLIRRLEEGWIPPAIDDEDPHELPGPELASPDLVSHPPPAESARKPLTPIVDSRGQEHDAYKWFDDMMRELSLMIPRETFDTHLRMAELVGYEQVDLPDGDGVCTLTIRLRNQYAHEWVTHRLHTVIQRLVDSMLGHHADIVYTAPHLEGSVKASAQQAA